VPTCREEMLVERMFVRRGDYPSAFYTPYKWHLLGTGQWVVADHDQRVWYNHTACRRYEIPDTKAEITFMDLSVPGEEQPIDICRWCLDIVRVLDSEGISDERV